MGQLLTAFGGAGRCSAPPDPLDPLGHGAEEGLGRGLEMVDLRLGLVDLKQDVTDRAVQVADGETQGGEGVIELRHGLAQLVALLGWPLLPGLKLR